MAYDVPQLLTMSQAQLDELFTNSLPGDIPDGEGKGTAIVAPGTTYTQEIAEFISHFAWQGKVFDAQKGVLKNKILPFGLQRNHRQGVQGTKLVRWQRVHCPGLLRDIVPCAVDSR